MVNYLAQNQAGLTLLAATLVMLGAMLYFALAYAARKAG